MKWKKLFFLLLLLPINAMEEGIDMRAMEIKKPIIICKNETEKKMKPNDFVTKYYFFAKDAADKFGFHDPGFLLAQMFAENSGESQLLFLTNNVGSLISRYTSPQGKEIKLPTNAYWYGDDVRSNSSGLWFRKYNNLQNAFYDFAHLLAAYYKLNTCLTVEDFAHAIANSPYIDEKNGDNRLRYEKNIIATYNSIKPFMQQNTNANA